MVNLKHEEAETAPLYDRLHLCLVKPSKYDDDGYVIRYWKGVLPSNTLACLYGLSEDVKKRGALGEKLDVEDDFSKWPLINTKSIPTKKHFPKNQKNIAFCLRCESDVPYSLEVKGNKNTSKVCYLHRNARRQCHSDHIPIKIY